MNRIDCDRTLKVTLALSAEPDISSYPTDIVLVLDRSGSIAGSPLANMKKGAKIFIDIIDEATDSSQDGNIGSGIIIYCIGLIRSDGIDVSVLNDWATDPDASHMAVILTEVDENGIEYERGMKTITIPAHHYPSCRDVLVKCIKFVLPEDLDVSGGTSNALCNARKFKARFIAHNIDTDYRCCDSGITFL